MKVFELRHLGVLTAICAVAPVFGATFAGRDSAQINFTESLRYVDKTTVEHDINGGSSTSSANYTYIKWKIDAELPLDDAARRNLGRDTVFNIQIGMFSFAAPLRSDPGYSVGSNSAHLLLLRPNPSGKTESVLVSATLKWDAGRLTATITSSGYDVSSIAAMDYKKMLSGDVQGETKASLSFAGQARTILIAFKGRIKRKSADESFVSKDTKSVSANVDLKGEGKTD